MSFQFHSYGEHLATDKQQQDLANYFIYWFNQHLESLCAPIFLPCVLSLFNIENLQCSTDLKQLTLGGIVCPHRCLGSARQSHSWSDQILEIALLCESAWTEDFQRSLSTCTYTNTLFPSPHRLLKEKLNQADVLAVASHLCGDLDPVRCCVLPLVWIRFL